MCIRDRGCVVIMDDILVFGKNAEEHDERLQRVMETIKTSGLKLNKESVKSGRVNSISLVM